MAPDNTTAPEAPPLRPAVRNTMVGCLTMFVGFFGGGMIAVLIGRGVDIATRCAAAEGLPICGNWALYVVVGGLIGAIGLPTIVLAKLLRSDAAARDSGQ